jgi:hypothetical protein
MTAVYLSTTGRKSNGVYNGANAAKSELNPNQNNQPTRTNYEVLLLHIPKLKTWRTLEISPS